MRLIYLAPLVLLLASCNPLQKKEETKTTTGAINSDAPKLWTDYDAAKTLKISSDFLADEITAIQEMSTAWETAIQNQKALLTYGAAAAELTGGPGEVDLNAISQDNVQGVYKTTYWPAELPTGALAVTQLAMLRHNTGTPSEFLQIVHGDILINYEWWDFDTGAVTAGWKYDLRTVVLHEMGHFFGLDHKSKSSDRTKSIMYPSIMSGEMKRAPKAIDIADLSSKYNITIPGGAGGGAAMATTPRTYVPSGEGIPVRILIELHANGECIHRVDGVVADRHRVDLKKD